MLVLTRRSGEEIIIDGNIRVTVVAISPSKVRIGITAPPFVAVDRLEVHERRAQVTAELSSPHTVQLYDFGVTETGTFYYVMERLHGMDLNEMVTRFGPLPAERVVALLDQACASLGEAHERGLVHRDIKPGNLFVAQLGGVSDFLKVLDFGMVKASDEEDSAQLTTAGKVHGTPAFMPPEMALGEKFEHVLAIGLAHAVLASSQA